MSERDIKSSETEIKKSGASFGRFKELFSKIFSFESKSARMERKYPNACRLIKSELDKPQNFTKEFKLGKKIITMSYQEIAKIKINNLSETTLQYLEDWENLEFGLNSPNLKNEILREVIFGDYVFMKEFKKDKISMSYLKEMGISVEECIADLQLYVDAVVSESQLFRATDHNVLINYILVDDERWKSQFETYTSGGCLDPTYRSTKEASLFGFPDHYSSEAKTKDKSSPYHVSKRPIYGFFTPDENGVLNSAGASHKPNATKQYGRVHCKIKESKYTETTISFGDSLDLYCSLSPFTKPHYTSSGFISNHEPNYLSKMYERMFEIDTDKKRVLKQVTVKNLHELIISSYTEIQIHNGLRMEDIESLHVSKVNNLNNSDILTLRMAVDKYNSRHPDSQIQVIQY